MAALAHHLPPPGDPGDPGGADAAGAPPARRRAAVRAGGWALAVAVLVVALAASLAVGSRTVPLDRVWAALADAAAGRPASGADAVVVTDLRLPRTALGLAAGLALALAGALAQAVTRNPLADPGVLGVTAGAAFAVAVAVGLGASASAGGALGPALAGALVTAVGVHLLGSLGRGGGTPVRLTVTGVAVGAVLVGATSALVLSAPRAFDALTVWRSGSLADRGWDALVPVAPVIAAGAVLALCLGPALNAVAVGDDLASALGVRVALVRALSLLAVTLLAGAATAAAGPVAFIGLAVPHVARALVGADQRALLAMSALLGPSALLAADVVARVVLPPGELPAGVLTALLGAPVLVWLVRRGRAAR